MKEFLGEKIFDLYDEHEMRKAFLLCNALNHPMRKKILMMLKQNGKMNVSSIRAELNVLQAIASQQLAILRRAKVVKTEKKGKQVFYSLNNENLRHISEMVSRLLNSKV